MTAHFEVVRSDAPKPWHGRYVVGAHTVWTTPQLSRQVGVERAILSLAREFGLLHAKLIVNVPGVEKILWSANAPLLSVVLKDERDPNRCACGHPLSAHTPGFGGCQHYDEDDGYCGCSHYGGTEGNATNGGAVLVVGSDG